MDCGKCILEHLPLKDGDVITVKGLTLEEFHEVMGATQKWRNQGPDVAFILLPEEGAFTPQTWEWLQEWQEERLKSER